MGSWRFIFAFSTSLLIQSVTVQFVRAAGGGAAAWRTVAIVYAIIGLIVNTISVFSIKELPEEELKAGKDYTEEKYGLVEAAKLLFLYRKFLKSSEIVYNRLEIKNDIAKERRGLRHDVVYEVFCFGLG